MTTPEYKRQQEAKWLNADKEAVGANKNITCAGLNLSVLLQDKNLTAGQLYVIQAVIDELEFALPYSIL